MSHPLFICYFDALFTWFQRSWSLSERRSWSSELIINTAPLLCSSLSCLCDHPRWRPLSEWRDTSQEVMPTNIMERNKMVIIVLSFFIWFVFIQRSGYSAMYELHNSGNNLHDSQIRIAAKGIEYQKYLKESIIRFHCAYSLILTTLACTLWTLILNNCF